MAMVRSRYFLTVMSRPPENPPIAFPRRAATKTSTPLAQDNRPQASDAPPTYAELQCVTNFSFLHGASHPGELVLQAKALGHTAIGIADANTLAGVVRAHTEAKRENMRLLVGARIDLMPTPSGTALSVITYPTDRGAYGRLCKLLSDGKRSAPKGECHIALSDLVGAAKGQVFIAVPPDDLQKEETQTDFSTLIETLSRTHRAGLWVALRHQYRGDDRKRMRATADVAERFELPLVATNDVLYHHPDRRELQDVIACIREGELVEQAGYLLEAHGERHLKPAYEMARLHANYPQAIEAIVDIMALCQFNLDELKYNYPNEPVPPGKTANGHLADLVKQGLAKRFDGSVPRHILKTIAKELRLIRKLNYAHYFLTVHDVVAFARSRKPPILCQGRGSAANSAVCYYLNVTAVDPASSSLLFERFLSEERKEPPDIDVDFEHERREEVIQHIYKRYGRHRAALTATVITYRPRSAVREVGKVLGLSEDVTSVLASTVWGSWGREIPEEHIKETGLDATDPKLRMAIELSQQLLGFPRHLSQHVGGFVLTEDPLEQMIPIGNAAMDKRTFIEWDKDDIDELGILKVDVLALGMLTCIAKSFKMIEQEYRLPLTLHTVETEDPKVYGMLQQADALGVFQVESRAQMNMLPRLKPQTYYDLVIEVAIVRPGPIQGDMVHPYLRRRDKLEEATYPFPANEPENRDELKNILKRTLGVPLFQEQAMQIAMDAAKFNAEEANQLRRAMATFRNVGTIHLLQTKMVSRMIKRGYEPEFAAHCFEQIKGFGSYGFPESHAASFALLVYASSWIKHYFPDVFCAALLNSQPMGFYAPAQIVRDAREHGVDVLESDINLSDWDNILEGEDADGMRKVRLGFRQLSGLKKEEMELFVERRAGRHLANPDEARRLTGLPVKTMERLASADAMRSMDMDRRAALWAVKGMTSDSQMPLFEVAQTSTYGDDPDTKLPEMPLREHVVADYQTQRLSLKAHPMAMLRKVFDTGIPIAMRNGRMRNSKRIKTARDLFQTRQNEWVTVAGVVLVRQKPGTAKGVVFITLEDETGTVNVVVWSSLMARYRRTIMGARMIAVHGKVQREGDIIHVVADQLIDRTADLDALSDDRFELQFANADHVKSPLPETSSSERKVSRMAARGDTVKALANTIKASNIGIGAGKMTDVRAAPSHYSERDMPKDQTYLDKDIGPPGWERNRKAAIVNNCANSDLARNPTAAEKSSITPRSPDAKQVAGAFDLPFSRADEVAHNNDGRDGGHLNPHDAAKRRRPFAQEQQQDEPIKPGDTRIEPMRPDGAKIPSHRHPRDVRIIPKSRDFH
ncbi:MAG: error-prone DNA polymerase [Pseudomonadota bacterium]